MSNSKNDLKIVINAKEEPYLVYLDDRLVMLEGGWRTNMLEPNDAGSWIELIKQHKTFSGVEETYQFSKEADEKYRLLKNHPLIPKEFQGFKKGELVLWNLEEEK